MEELLSIFESNDNDIIISNLYTYFNSNDKEYISRELVKLGNKLLTNRYQEKAFILYQTSYELDKNNITSIKAMFIKKMIEKDYDDAINFFIKIYEYYGDKDNNINYLLCLLNEIIDLPSKYKKNIPNIVLEDIDYSNDNSYLKSIRRDAFYKKYALSLRNLKQYLINNKNDLNLDLFIERHLIGLAADKYKESRNITLNLVKNKKYDELISYLSKDNKKLIKNEEVLLHLAKEYKKLKEHGTIPVTKNINNESFHKMILKNDFINALENCISFSLKHNLKIGDNVYAILLSHVLYEIDSIKSLKNDKINFIIYLMNNDINKALFALKNYLLKNNSIKYFGLLASLIKLSATYKDFYYDIAIKTFVDLKNINFNNEISKYLHKFNFYESVGNVALMKAYYDVIKETNKFIRIKVSLNELKSRIDGIKHISLIECSNIEEADVSLNSYNSIDEYVSIKYDELLNNGGMLLLDEMNFEDRKKALSLLRKFKDVSSFIIRDKNTKRIVIKKNTHDSKDILHIVNAAMNAFKKSDYDSHIKYSLEIINNSHNVRGIVCIKLGMSYMRKKMYDEAINYLVIGNGIINKYDNINDFSELINELREKRKYIRRKKLVNE